MFQPTTFGKYFLTRRIAVGGMAEVFAAKLYGADGFEKDLVIKQILPQYARDPEFVQSFVTEAKIAVSLTHANIVGIYELGRVDGTYFIAMELVDGLDGFTLVQEATAAGVKIDVGAALFITEEVAKGLDYAHRKVGADGLPLGLVHRDLNPRNVLVSREGDVKILDFGIAKTASRLAAMPKTRAGVVKGTTGYMSPEQATGRAIDARTDVYQAGLLLWELLAHQPLFWRPDDQETRERMRRHHIAPPSTLAFDVPREIDEVVLAALTRNPDERVQTAAELARRIGHIRYARYPDVTPVSVGRLVASLMDRKATKATEAQKALPSTVELDDAIREAISTSGQQETIARAPSDVVRARPLPPSTEPMPPSERPSAFAPKPTSAESPSQLARHPVVERPAVPPRVVDERRPATPDEPPDPLTLDHLPAQPDRSRWVLASAVLLVLVLAGVVAYRSGIFDPPPVEPITRRDPPPPPTVVAPPPTKTATVAEAPPPPPAKVRAPPPTKAPPRTVEREAFAHVAFGTRSCSSRVSLDGNIIARSTPSFDHQIAAGDHVVVIEGTSCPPIERPGSLRRTIPTVKKRIRIEGGTRLKVIADYEREQVIVRRE